MRVSYKWVADHYQANYRFKYYRYEDFKAKKEPIVDYIGLFDGSTFLDLKPLNNHSKITWIKITDKPEETATIYIYSIDSQMKGSLQTIKVDMIEAYENVLKPKISRL